MADDCDRLSAEKLEGLVQKWLCSLPSPFTAADRSAGYRYAVSVLQADMDCQRTLNG